jgi:hypothetical protein
MILICRKCGKEIREPQPELIIRKCCGELMMVKGGKNE